MVAPLTSASSCIDIDINIDINIDIDIDICICILALGYHNHTLSHSYTHKILIHTQTPTNTSTTIKGIPKMDQDKLPVNRVDRFFKSMGQGPFKTCYEIMGATPDVSIPSFSKVAQHSGWRVDAFLLVGERHSLWSR